MGILWRDIRYGFRLWCQSPALTAIVVLILGVAIGATTAMFSVVNAVILRALPYADADRLVTITERPKKIETSTIHERFLLWRQQNAVFEQIAAYRGGRPYVTGIDRPRYVWAAVASADLLPLLGVQPILGRGFRPDEEEPGHDNVVIVSDAFWRADLGATEEAIGTTLVIDGRSHTVIGVMPAGFSYPVGRARALWVPLVYEGDPNAPYGGIVLGLGRLKKGRTLAQARASMNVIADRLQRTYPDAGPIAVRGLLDRKLGRNRQLLWLLLGAAGFVLLIACTNVASLLLARATMRQREMAMRAALGASRGRLVSQMLTESLMLSAVAGLLGLLLTVCTVKGLVGLCPADIPRLTETTVDWPVLVFTLGISVLTGLIFGVVPACRASGVHISRTLKEGQTRSSTGRRWRRLHGGLVIAQTGSSLVLLIGAALLMRTWIALHREDLGFRSEQALTVEISLLESSYPVYDGCEAFFEPLLQRVRSLPGVRAAALTPYLDFGRGMVKSPFSIAGQAQADPENGPSAKDLHVTAGFFEALGMRLLKGRTFGEADTLGAARHLIIDENLMRQYFGDIDPIGQKVRFDTKDYTIVGVVSTLKDFHHLDPAVGVVFRPWNQYWRDTTLVVRTEGDPLRLAGAIRAEVAALEKDQVITDIGTLEASLSDLLAPQRFAVVLLGLFAGVSLALAWIGIYGLLRYSTARQTHDIGIRMALGARRVDILRAVLGQGFRLILIGVIIGMGGAVALTRVLSSLLYGVTPTDPVTLVLVSCMLVAVALLASYLPARRAARVDPMVALRYE